MVVGPATDLQARSFEAGEQSAGYHASHSKRGDGGTVIVRGNSGKNRMHRAHCGRGPTTPKAIASQAVAPRSMMKFAPSRLQVNER
jgi:hypothetical protein